MKNNERKIEKNESIEPDTKADKTGKDDGADKTGIPGKPGVPKLIPDPDTTGIDNKADKTKVEIFPIQH